MILDQCCAGKNQPAITTENIFHVDKLSKSYGSLNVVRGISFRVKQFECFGLLGVNGAGKSTTFRMLTGEEIPRGGSIYLKEFNIETEREKVRRSKIDKITFV